MVFIAMVCSVLLVGAPAVVFAQTADGPSAAAMSPTAWQYGGFVDVGYLRDFNEPSNHLFRSRGTAFYVNEWDLNRGASSRTRPLPGSRRRRPCYPQGPRCRPPGSDC